MFRDPIEILKSLPAVFLAMSFHEFAHAFMANHLGDPTPRNQGRLTLDPLVHIDWMGLVMFAVFGFGWAKPVKVNPSNFKNKKWGDIIVSLAGPIANLLLAVLGTIIYVLLIRFYTVPIDAIMDIIHYIIYLNIIFAILNIIPIPPFDGYHVLKDLFFRRNAKFFWKYEQYSMYILFAFILLGLFNIIVDKPAIAIYQFLLSIGLYIF